MENINIYEKNLSELKNNYQSIYDYVVKENNIEDIYWDKSGSNEDILAVNKENRLYYLNSRYSDDEQSSKWAEQYKKVNYKAIFVIFGIANFSYAKKLLKIIGNENVILLYEPNKRIFAKSIEKVDISEILNADNLIMCINELNDDCLAEFIVQTIDYAIINHVKYCCMPNYDELYINEWKNLINTIKERYEIVIMSRNTEILFAREFVKNNLMNCRDMVHQFSINQLIEKVKEIPSIENIPAIIVSAGPSLDKNILELRQAKGKSMIICVDTALKSMLKNDIIPDLIVTIDPHKPPILFMEPRFKDIPMVVCECSNSDLWILHSGKRFYFSDSKSYMSKLYQSVTGESLQPTETGGSVANNAFSLAQILGFNTIVLIGQDLAYIDKKMHASGAYGGSEQDKLGDDKRYFEVEDIYGGKVLTESNMNLYRKWFETQIIRWPNLKVIDATEGGAKIAGTEIFTLKETIKRECLRNVDFENIIDKIKRPISKEDAAMLVSSIDNMNEELEDAKKKIRKGIRKYEKLEELSRKGKTTGTEFKRVVGEIDEISQYVENEEILELANTYEKGTEYDILGKVYNTKDEIKDEIRDITNNGIKMLESYIKGIDMLMEDTNREPEKDRIELIDNINAIIKISQLIRSHECDWSKINGNMKNLYNYIVRVINILANENDSQADYMKLCLNKIVEAHTRNDINKLTEIIVGELDRYCEKIKVTYE